MSPGDTTAPVKPAANAKVVVKGAVSLGDALELHQRKESRLDAAFSFSAALPTDGGLTAPDIGHVLTRSASNPAEQLGWELRATNATLEIRDKGLTESYMMFGGPGSGKTYLLMYLLRQLFALNVTDSDSKPGGLILDPKAALVEDVQNMLAKAGRLDDLVVLSTETLQREDRAVNIVDAGLDPSELGSMLVLAAQSAGTDASEPFWFGSWTTLFGSAVPLLAWRDEQTLTLESLMSAVLEIEGSDEAGRPMRRVQRIARQAVDRLNDLPVDRRRDMRMAIDEVESFYRQELDNIATVETLMRRAYSGFLRSKWKRYSAVTPNLPAAGRTTFYDQIIDQGKIVLVSVSPSEPSMAKIICTLVKVLFQRTILSRLDRVRSGTLTNFKRLVLMAVDEYSAVASEIQGQPMGDGLFLSQCRQNGCIALLATQSVNLLQTSSLKDNWKAVTSTCAAKIYMRLGDNETAEEATKLAGEYDWYLTSRGTSQQKDGAGSSTNTEMRERKALPAAVLTQTLKLGQAAMIGSLDGKQTLDTLRFFKCPSGTDRVPDASHRHSNQDRSTRDREQAEKAARDAPARVAGAVTELTRQARQRLTATGGDLSRHLDNMRAYLAQNPSARTLDAKARSGIDAAVERFSSQQQAHLQESERRADGIRETLSRTAATLEAQQRAELDHASPAERPQLQQFHERQQADLAKLAETTRATLSQVRANDDERLRGERQTVDRALTAGSPEQIRDTLLELDREHQRSRLPEKTRASTEHPDMNALAGETRRAAAAILGALKEDEAQQWRAKLGDVARELDDRALTRIRLAGESRKDPANSLDAIKGQLFEELMSRNSEVQKLVSEAQRQLQEQGIQAKVQFFAGDRLRDGGNRKLTDGVLAWADEERRLHIVKILEAKAGAEAAEKLNALIDKMTEPLRVETEKEARSHVRDEIAEGKVNPQDEDARYREVLQDLLSDETQRELGQLTRSQERMTTSADYDTRIYLDGQRALLARDQRRAAEEGVTPKDVVQDRARQLEWTQREIEEAAIQVTALMEEERERRRREAEVIG